jgi:hypothetical protein
MKIVQKLSISDKATFEQLTPSEQNLWTKFETEDIYRFFTGEPDTMPEFQYNWTSIPRLQPLGPTLYAPPSPAADQALPAPAAPQVPSPAPPLGHHIQRQLLPPLGRDRNKVSQQPQSQLHLTHQAH